MLCKPHLGGGRGQIALVQKLCVGSLRGDSFCYKTTDSQCRRGREQVETERESQREHLVRCYREWQMSVD